MGMQNYAQYKNSHENCFQVTGLKLSVNECAAEFFSNKIPGNYKRDNTMKSSLLLKRMSVIESGY